MSTLAMNKNLIRQCFEKSRVHYDQHATIQAQMSTALLHDLQQLPINHFESVLEIGCGTGLLTRLLIEHFKIQHYTVNDLVENSLVLDPLSQTTDIHFLSGDIEQLTELPKSLDLVVSNAAFQWMENIQALLEKLVPCIKPSGWLAFSTFGPDNLKELTSLTGLGLTYPTCETLKQILSSHFDLLALRDEKVTLEFPDALSVIQHLRATGVNSLSNRLWTKKQLHALLAQYEKHYRNDKGVQLTYHPMVFLLQRKKWQPV